MKLVIAEKPSVAMALASVIGARTRKDGYVESFINRIAFINTNKIHTYRSYQYTKPL